MLTLKHKLEDSFYDLAIEDLGEFYPGPTLYHLSEGEGRPLFISVLLHGNEHSGFLAIQKLLHRYHIHKKELERPLLLFIGNPQAAAENKRMLSHQPDYNRIWDGDHPLAKEVLTYVHEHKALCCVDIHNNTGNNPFYSCINVIDDNALHLARFFADTLVYFTEPHEVLSLAMSKIMPSITIEAGRSGEREGIERLIKKLEILFTQDIFRGEINRSKITLLHTIARMRFEENTLFDFNFHTNGSVFSFLNRIDEFNFQELAVGTTLAKASSLDGFVVERSADRDPLHHFFKVEEGELRVAAPFIPAMITKNVENIHADCFGYIMESYPLD